MALSVPEPRSLATWEDAFQQPLPVVRKLEQQLRRNIEENRQKLRSLVGASYRDLLGTAERIVEMDEQIQHVEGHFGDVGRKCNAKTVDRMQQNLLRMRRDRILGDQKKYGTLAQTKLLQSALSVTLRIIRDGGDALLASKVLVLARLIHKSIVENDEEPSAALEELEKRSRTARKRLLSYIARSLIRADADRTYTVHSLCAYSMITSSAPRDVLRYFLQVRFAQLEATTTENTPSDGDLMDALELFRRTLADTKDLFPRRFADAISQVSEAALVQDHNLRAVDELSLDIHEQWIAEDVRNFKPWTRHEQVSSSEVKDALASWTRQAQACLLQGITDALEQQTDPALVLTLRQRILSRYLFFSITFRDDRHVHAIEDVRRAFVMRLEQILERFAQMADFSLDLQSVSGAADHGLSSDSWSLAPDDFDLSRGAIKFRQAILRREHGRSDTVQRFAESLGEWVSRVEKASSIISSLRGTRWDDDVELDLDELENGEVVMTALSKQDPQQLSLKLQDAVKQSLRDAYSNIREQSSESSVAAAATILRLVRELDLHSCSLAPEFAELKTVQFDRNVVDALHQRVAASVADAALKEYARRARAPRHVPTALWDGEPALPVQPSPGAFKFLATVHRQMSQAGHDLWSPAAVRTAKIYLAAQLERQRVFGDGDDDAPAQRQRQSLQNGGGSESHVSDEDTASKDVGLESNADVESTTAPPVDQSRDRLLQRTFDGLYLQRVLSTDTKDGDGLQGVVGGLIARLELDGVARERLRKSAMDYWRRTYLLFGLLAGHQAV